MLVLFCSPLKIGNAYRSGEIIAKDTKKAKQHLWGAGYGRRCKCKYNLAILENDSGNVNRAINTW